MGSELIPPQARVELPHHLDQAVCLGRHLGFVMDDKPGDAVRESPGEFRDP